MTDDGQRLTVTTVDLMQGRGPVFYASMPAADRTLQGCGTDGAGEKHRIVSGLWEHFVTMDGPFWQRRYSSTRADIPIRVVSGALGRPHLLVGTGPGPAISFSRGGGQIWAALSGDGSDIGIDAAGPDEFPGDYPFHRVFHPEELHHAVELTGGDRKQASALLWSVKEAAVKALGCGFHLVEPRQMTVYPAVGRCGGYTFPVGLSGKALERFPQAAVRPLSVRSLPRGTVWFSIARIDRRVSGHE